MPISEFGIAMLVSWNWLKQYVLLDMPHEELARRLMMAGLNHESTEEIEGDLAIDLEVTSNRPDCLGHLGIARETAVLFGHPLQLPAAAPAEGRTPVDELVRVRIDCPDLCYRYCARVVRGVKIGPSPRWLARRLETVGITAINNVVDISNYVMMECGQPLHTFDYGRLTGAAIIVRRPRGGETIEAIDHKSYVLPADACVIADGENPVAIAGVMGGAATEIASRTTSVLIEAAEFAPLSIRNTARLLNLHSDSSYRFERKIDPEGVDWAGRRCAELILELAGGELAAGAVDVVAVAPPARKPITLRYAQLRRILGIDVDPAEVRRILTALGNTETAAAPDRVTVIAPSWRRDLTREIDLVEEVARIHGYEKIPEDVLVPMAPSTRNRQECVVDKIRAVLTGAGFDEAMTLSAVDEATSAAFSPWTDAAPLRSSTPVLRGADHLRRSLVPSLLVARRTNESLANTDIELFEIARVYLPRTNDLPDEPWMIGITSGQDFAAVKGAIEALVAVLDPQLRVAAEPYGCDLLDPDQSARLTLGAEPLGFLGRLRNEALERFGLRQPTVVAELRLGVLVERAQLVPYFQPLPAYPGVTRDINLVVGDGIRWSEMAATVEAAAGDCFEALHYRDTYRDAERLGPGKKSLLMTLTLRSKTGTLTNQQADEIRDRIVAAATREHGAQLRM
jgi:phenylalanyl-tRNA synthetase beta chain